MKYVSRQFEWANIDSFWPSVAYPRYENSYFPSDVYMRRKSIYLFYSPRGRPEEEFQVNVW